MPEGVEDVFFKRYGSGGHEGMQFEIRNGLNSEEILANLHVSTDCINNTTSPLNFSGKIFTCSTIFILIFC
jgi:hypothetical protein